MSGLLFPKGQSTRDQRLNSIPVNQSAFGAPIPLTYGKTRVPMTLAWYGDFTATPHTEKTGGKGGGSSHTGYTYTAAVVMVLGEGACTDVHLVWADRAQKDLSSFGTLFTGTAGQAVWSHLSTNHPTEAIGYSHTAYVANAALPLGSTAAMPNLTFELLGMLPFNLGGGIQDAEPSDILIDYCTHAVHGCSFPYLGTLQGAGTDTYESYCIAMGFFLAPSERTQRPASEFIREMLMVTNSQCVWSAGVLKVQPLADASVTGNGRTYTPNLTPQFTFGDNDFLHEGGEDPVKVERKPPSQRFNIIRVEILNRANQYNPEPVEAKDDNDIALHGERAAPTITLHCIVEVSVGRKVAQLILQRQLFVVNTYKFKVRADYSLLEPLDYVALNESTIGLASKLVRIIETEDSERDEFGITAEEVLVGTAGAPVYDWQEAAGYAANFDEDPGDIDPPLLFAAPPLLVGFGGGYELWIAASGAAALWGGCDVYMSMDDAVYEYIGTIFGAARYGELTATLPSATGLDVTNTLEVQLADADLQMASGSNDDVAQNRTLLFVDGEIMSYRDAALTAPGAYDLAVLQRAQYGSSPQSHGIGTPFARIDSALFRVPYDPGMVGQTAYFKFCSFNVYGGGKQDISAVSPYSKVLPAVNAGGVVPGPVTLVGRGVTVVGDRAFRSAPYTGTWDADCYSVQSYVNGAVVEFRPLQSAVSEVMVGLNTDPSTDSDYTSIDYALYCYVTGQLIAYESGMYKGGIGTYAAGDVLSISYDGAIVRYLQNGVVLREVMAGPDIRFHMDSAFFIPGHAIEGIRFGPYGTAAPVMFNARGNCVVSDTHVGKVGGSNSWDSDIYSLKDYPTCHVSFKPSRTDAHLMVGLGASPLGSTDYLNIDRLWYCTNAGTLDIYESGSNIGSFGVYTTKTVLAITYDGTDVRYYKDGVVVRTVNDPGKSFYLDSSFYTPGAALNSLRFGPTTNLDVIDTSQISTYATHDSLNAQDAGPVNYSTALGSAFESPIFVTLPRQEIDEVVKVECSFRIVITGSAGFTFRAFAARSADFGTSSATPLGAKSEITQPGTYFITVVGWRFETVAPLVNHEFGLSFEITGDGVNVVDYDFYDMTLRLTRYKR